MRNRFVAILLMFAVVITSVSGCTHKETMIQTSPSATANTYASNVLVWRVPTHVGLDTNEFAKSCNDEINRILKEDGAEYKVLIEEYRVYEEVLQHQENPDEQILIKPLLSCRDSNQQTDLITPIRPGRFFRTLMTRPYEELIKSKCLLPLDEYLTGAEATDLAKAMPQNSIDACRYHGELYGLGVLYPMYASYAYDSKMLEAIGINQDDIRQGLFPDIEVAKKLKAEYGGAPFRIDMLDYYRNASNKPLLEIDTENIVYDKERGFISVTATNEFKNMLHEGKNWLDNGLLEMSFRDIIKFHDKQELEPLSPINAGVYAGSYTTNKITKQFDTEGKEFTVVPRFQTSACKVLGDVCTGIASWSQKPEQSFDFLKRLFTDTRIANAIQHGVEGKDYVLATDGTIEVSPNREEQLTNYASTIINSLITYRTATDAEDKRQFYDEYFQPLIEQGAPIGFRMDISSLQEEIVAVNNAFESHPEYADVKNNTLPPWLKLMALEVDDIDQGIAELDKELKRAGIDKIIAEANRQLAEWRKQNEMENKR